MRNSLIKILAVAAASVLSSGGVKAAPLTNTYTVVGSNFSSTAPSPFAAITESFTISFNTATTVSQQSSGISLNNASTVIPASPLAFTYVAATDTLIVGGTAATVTTSDSASTDFALVIQNASHTADFSITSLTFSIGTGAVFTANSRTTGTPPTTPIPEPASLLLLATAGATLAFSRHHRIKT